jgi:hypothetical protein
MADQIIDKRTVAIPGPVSTVPGPQGLPGVNAVPADEAVAAYMSGSAGPTLTFSALSRRGIDVHDFGALGDGVADDTQSIKKAISYASGRGGGVVLFPKGTYRSSALTLPSFVSLQGLGWPRLKLVDYAPSSVDDVVAVTGDRQSMGGVHGMIIDGNQGKQDHPVNGINIAGTGQGALYSDHYGDVTDCFVTFCSGDGLVVSAPTRSLCVRRVTAINNTGNGFNLSGSDNFYSDLISAANGGDGLLVSSANCVFTACKSFWCKIGFHAINGDHFPIMGLQLVGCQMQENAAHGYYLARCFAATLSGCVSDSDGRTMTGSSGFYLDDCESCHVTGTVCNNPALAGVIKYSMAVTGKNSKDNVVDLCSGGTGANIADLDPVSFDYSASSTLRVDGYEAGLSNMAAGVDLTADSNLDGVADGCVIINDAGLNGYGVIDGTGQIVNCSNVPKGRGVAWVPPKIPAKANNKITVALRCRSPYPQVAKWALQYECFNAAGESIAGVNGMGGQSWNDAWITLMATTPALPATTASVLIKAKIVNVSDQTYNIQGLIRDVTITCH